MHIPTLSISRAVGPPRERHDREFNDLQLFGEWPAQQKIQRIKSVLTFFDNQRVTGMQVEYQLFGEKDTKVVVHGSIHNGQSSQQVRVEDGSHICAVAGGLTIYGEIKSICFTLLHTSTTAPSPFQVLGPFGNPEPPEKTFHIAGHSVIAFHGSDNNAYGLRNLGFVISSNSINASDPLLVKPETGPVKSQPSVFDPNDLQTTFYANSVARPSAYTSSTFYANSIARPLTPGMPLLHDSMVANSISLVDAISNCQQPESVSTLTLDEKQFMAGISEASDLPETVNNLGSVKNEDEVAGSDNGICR